MAPLAGETVNHGWSDVAVKDVPAAGASTRTVCEAAAVPFRLCENLSVEGVTVVAVMGALEIVKETGIDSAPPLVVTLTKSL